MLSRALEMVKRAGTWRIGFLMITLLVVGLLNILTFTDVPSMLVNAPRDLKDYIVYRPLLANLKPVEFRNSALNVGQRPLYVSLTSIVGKQRNVYGTVRSLLQQSILADRITLYLSREKYLQDTGFPPEGITYAPLAELVRTEPTVEVEWVENTGPYRKLIPALSKMWNDDVLLVPVDDDVRYHPYLLENLVRAYNKHGCAAAGRSWIMLGVKKEEDVLNWTYDDKKPPPAMVPQKYILSTGIGGVLYHPTMFHKTPWVLDKSKFKELAPFGDDIWFNFARIANDVPIVTTKVYMMSKNGIKGLSLWQNYNIKGGNDKQIHDVMRFVIQNQKA